MNTSKVSIEKCKLLKKKSEHFHTRNTIDEHAVKSLKIKELYPSMCNKPNNRSMNRKSFSHKTQVPHTNTQMNIIHTRGE